MPPARGLRCAVLGDPIGHSLSPALHRAGYDATGLSGWTYETVQVAAGGLARLLAGLGGVWPPGEWRGLSLTMPLKREVLPLVGSQVSSISHRARLVGAVNTLVRTGYGWAGDNTDLPGAVAAVRERWDGTPSSGVVLGAGATAASTGLALVELGAREVAVLARDADRAAETVAVISAHPVRPTVAVLPLDAAPEAEIVVSTIPAAAQSPELVARWRDVPVLFEVVYEPWPTPLLSAATGTVVSGLDLLVHQAVLQFELFTGQAAPLAVMRAAGERALGIAPPAEHGVDPAP